MNTATTIIGVIMLSICILPFVLLNRGKSNSEKQLLYSLSNFAHKLNGKITLHDYCGGIVIGLDETANILFFVKQINGNEICQHIHLSEVQSCKVVSTSRAIKNKQGKGIIIEKVELSFAPVIKGKPDVLWEFYNASDSPQLDGEPQLVEKWAKAVNERIKL